MKALLRSLFILLFCLSIRGLLLAQGSYVDNFDSYPAGKSMNNLNNPFWSYTPNTFTITNEKAFSGNQCAKLTWVGNSSNTFFKIPNIDTSYEVSFKFWLKPNETADFFCFDSFGGISFRAPGFITISGLSGAKIMYESDRWNDFRFVYIVKEQMVYYYLNGSLVGSNKLRRAIRANFDINLFQNTGFYIDDFLLKTINPDQHANDIGLIKTHVEPLDMEGELLNMSVAVHNFGDNPVNGFIIEREYDGAISTQTFDETIMPDTFLTLVFNDSFFVQPDFKNTIIRLKYKDNIVTDEKPYDNTFTFLTKGIKKSNKKVLLEYITGTWCGTCPAAVVSYRDLKSKFGNQVESVFAHTGDVMELSEYNFPEIDGIPSGFSNREYLTYLLDDFQVLRTLDEAPSISMDTKLLFHEADSSFNVVTQIEALEDYDQPLYHSIVLVEDSIRSTDPAYRQSNFYSGGQLGPMGGFENLPGVIPAELMVYSNVPRILLHGMNGTKFSNGLHQGEIVELSDLIPMHIHQTAKHFYIYHIIFDFNRKVKHFTRVHIPDVLEIISDQLNTQTLSINVYPNPASDVVKIESDSPLLQYSLHDPTGQLLMEKSFSDGNLNIPLNISHLPTGIYSLSLKTKNGTIVRRLCKI